MADQDFKIKVVTTADTSGIRETSDEIDKLKQKAATPATAQIANISKLGEQITGLATSFGTGLAGGLAVLGPALGIAVSGLRQLIDETNRYEEKVAELNEKIHEMNLSLIETFEWSEKLSNIHELPLAERIAALRYELQRLKAERDITNPQTMAEDWKKLMQQINQVSGALNSATSAQKRFDDEQAKSAAKAAAEAAKKEAAEQKSFGENAYGSSSAQAKAILENERRAQRARDAGDEITADRFQKTADQLRKSATPDQRAEADQLAGKQPVGRKADVGESQEAVDQMERNRINNERAQKGQSPLKEGESSNMKSDLQAAVEAAMDKYWGR